MDANERDLAGKSGNCIGSTIGVSTLQT